MIAAGIIARFNRLNDLGDDAGREAFGERWDRERIFPPNFDAP